MNQNQPSAPFVLASWAALIIGITTFCIGLFNASIELSSKGFYFITLMFGLFGAVSVQKSVRDSLDNIPVTDIYYGLSWVATLLPIVMLLIGLWNADMLLSEKGFYGVAFILSIFAAIVVQKNVRDKEAFDGEEKPVFQFKTDAPTSE